MKEIAKELEKDYYNDEVIVIDDSPMKKQYTELAKELGIELDEEKLEEFKE